MRFLLLKALTEKGIVIDMYMKLQNVLKFRGKSPKLPKKYPY